MLQLQTFLTTKNLVGCAHNLGLLHPLTKRRESSAFWNMCKFFPLWNPKPNIFFFLQLLRRSAYIYIQCVFHTLYVRYNQDTSSLLSHPWSQLEKHVQNIRPRTRWQRSILGPNKPGQTSSASSMHLWNIAACSDELPRRKMSIQFNFCKK